VLTGDVDWAVVQQGMNEASSLTRRYHWHSGSVRHFTSDPHTAVVGQLVMSASRGGRAAIDAAPWRSLAAGPSRGQLRLFSKE
jgi:hypothetical protein